MRLSNKRENDTLSERSLNRETAQSPFRRSGNFRRKERAARCVRPVAEPMQRDGIREPDVPSCLLACLAMTLAHWHERSLAEDDTPYHLRFTDDSKRLPSSRTLHGERRHGRCRRRDASSSAGFSGTHPRDRCARKSAIVRTRAGARGCASERCVVPRPTGISCPTPTRSYLCDSTRMAPPSIAPQARYPSPHCTGTHTGAEQAAH